MQFLAAVLLASTHFTFLINPGDAANCYVCDSEKNPECGSDFSADSDLVQQCPDTCLQVEIRNTSETRFLRGCGSCPQIYSPEAGVSCSFCMSDYCNGPHPARESKKSRKAKAMALLPTIVGVTAPVLGMALAVVILALRKKRSGPPDVDPLVPPSQRPRPGVVV